MSDHSPRTSPDDGELFFRMCHGDEPAYRLLHDRHQAAVFQLALLLMRTVRDAEEVAATAFLDLWRRRKKVRVVEGSVLPWLLAAVSRVARHGIARARYRRELRAIPADDAAAADHATLSTAVVRSLGISRALGDALPTLRARDTSILALCEVHGMSAGTAALVIGIPETTVEARLARLTARFAGPAPRFAGDIEEATA